MKIVSCGRYTELFSFITVVDERIIKQIKKGDKQSFRAIYEHYFNALTAFGYKYVQDQYTVEDMVQEVFVSLWQARSNFDHMNALKSFLYTSVRNKCLNHIKHQAVKQKHHGALLSNLESEQYFEGHVIEEETFNQLFAEIRKLPDAAQEIMLLALNGLKNQEIADELRVSVNTVKTQKKISYARLKEALGPAMNTILILMIFG